tara:strand:+ start:153217 stop:154077 length:861 start_codon:yes stop_codon:yes gene_type:complete
VDILSIDSNILFLLLSYSLAIFGISLLGGRLSEYVTLTHTRTQFVMSLVAGFLLGIAMFHLLLHSLEDNHEPGGSKTTIGFMVLGIILIVVMLRIFRFHQHEISHEAVEMQEKQNNGNQSNNTDGINRGSVLSIGLGLGLHTVIEGIALGASIQRGLAHEGTAILVGLGVFLAIMAHKPLEAYFIIALMRVAGYTKRACTLTNYSFAILCPVITILTFVGIGMFSELHISGYIMAFSAGVFVCISLGDLLPEIHFHSHDRGILAVAFLLGIGLAYCLFLYESRSFH